LTREVELEVNVNVVNVINVADPHAWICIRDYLAVFTQPQICDPSRWAPGYFGLLGTVQNILPPCLNHVHHDDLDGHACDFILNDGDKPTTATKNKRVASAALPWRAFAPRFRDFARRYQNRTHQNLRADAFSTWIQGLLS
jgi:hypothetical protein